MRMSITKFVPGLVAHNLPVEPYVDDYRSTNHESVISLPHSDRGSQSIYIPTRLLFPRRLALTISRCSPTSYGWQPIGMNTSAPLVPYEGYLARHSRAGRAIRAVQEWKHTAVGQQVRPPAPPFVTSRDRGRAAVPPRRRTSQLNEGAHRTQHSPSEECQLRRPTVYPVKDAVS